MGGHSRRDGAQGHHPGRRRRNLAVLVEAAVRNHILKLRGVDSTAEFLARQKRKLDGSESEGEK